MSSKKSAAFYLTLLIAVTLALALASPAEANGHLNRRSHVNLKRMIKLRAPSPQLPSGLPLPPVAGAAPSPSLSESDEETATASSTSTSASASSSSSTSAASSSSQSSSSASSSSESASSSASESESESSSSTSESATSSSTSSETPTPTPVAEETPEAPPQETNEQLNLTDAPAENTDAGGPPTVTQTHTRNVEAPENTDTPAPQGNAAQNTTAAGTTLTVIIAIAASVGGITILWTIFRKWKLGRSSNFDKRLQPITDWQPTNPEDDIVPAPRRANSTGSSSHGHSGGSRSENGHGATGLQPLPDHDFTPGPSLTAVGGYADLARGPSPQPQMQEALRRGPNFTAGGYNPGLPLHHQTGYSNNGNNGGYSDTAYKSPDQCFFSL
ncbi:hypothetical protein AX16_009747 [Volvariella volvacea WC 439]|nr:hypothetical protein AX16_009747 [Volvariella volvacea WC 439]